jgi:peptidyl-prolyl cis-trans isomerase SurA
MNRLRGHIGSVLVALLALFLPSSLSAQVIEQVIVVIDREPYTLSDLRDYATTRMGRQFPSGDLNAIEAQDREVLEQFITEKLLADEVKRAGIGVSEQDIDQYIDQIRERNRISEEELKAALSREGVSIEKYRASIRAEIEKSEIINRQVRKRVNITPEDIERYYQLNRKKFTTEERVRLRHILLSLAKGGTAEKEKELVEKAGEIRRRALSGEEFAKLARAYSEGAGAEDGGDIGWVKRGSLIKEIEEVAFQKLPVGDVSEPLRTSLGFHLIRLEEKDSGRLLPLGDVRGKIREELYATALEERYQKWLKTDLRKNHRVDVKLPGVIFRPEDTKEGTVDTLLASTSRRSRREERSFLSYLNPFSYITKETPIEGEDAQGQLSGRNVVSIFGVPLFTKESVDDVPADPLAPLERAEKAPLPSKEKESSGSSSFWKWLNPFSRDR